MVFLIKTGDSLAVPIRFRVNETGIPIVGDVTVTASAVNENWKIIANATVTPYPDQDQEENAGRVLLEVPASVTKNWKEGNVLMDVKLMIGTQVRHSKTLKIKVDRSITP